jgi:hypothetical protein
MLKAYLSALQRAPVRVKIATAGVLFAVGDTANQTINYKNNGVKYDYKGALIFTAFGALFYAPTNHLWFAWMERNVACGATWNKQPMLQAFARVTLHSIVYAPFSIVSLFTWNGLFSGHSSSQIMDVVSPSKMFPIWLTGSVFWVPTMLGIYRFVPLQARVLAASVANVFWTTYLSFKKTVLSEVEQTTILKTTTTSIATTKSTTSRSDENNTA